MLKWITGQKRNFRAELDTIIAPFTALADQLRELIEACAHNDETIRQDIRELQSHQAEILDARREAEETLQKINQLLPSN